MNKPEYIVVHTAAFIGKNCDAAMIDAWHRDRGWSGIGYHFCILDDLHDEFPDGTIQTGRKEFEVGAHATGLNKKSLGICVIGNGDKKDFTIKEYRSLYVLCAFLMKKYPAIKLENVIGHREKNILIERGELDGEYYCQKTCPGKLIDMNFIRRNLAERYL